VPTPPTPQQNLFSYLFSDFVEEKTRKDKMKNMTF
jgi:hypothetical protein